MTFLGSLGAVARSATGSDGVIDWQAAARAAKSSTPPGDLSVSSDQQQAYAADVREARAALTEAAGVPVPLPHTIEIQNRHHWIASNIDTFSRVLAPLDGRSIAFAGATRVVNTGTMALMLSFLGRSVLGQYDPVLLADEDHGLYFVHPNIGSAAESMAVDRDRFRRWIAFHEVAHAAEFALAPWLSDHLETRVTAGVSALAAGRLDRDTLRDLDTTMTAVEGYAELLMDRAFDGDPSELRNRMDARRRHEGPIRAVLSRLLGIRLKRRQYERGAAFFTAVANARGLEAAAVAWDRPETLPRSSEIDHPEAWLRRVDP
ncbi:MAG: zinc-dependent metalloprotease [Halobacteriales archaeon]|nr:zinc-dependent metalloprotease [Halobacteriales archaeon]